ncbi:MAG: DUF5127 domain-containing protein, partial [Bacteroidaceae bacterium]|nr:DUF5127 domain-containing protein [Bacteroidaceae bacterium]
MKKIVLSVALAAISMTGLAQSTEFFKPYKQTDLRLPSVPLVVSDPYFSIWSPYDKLTDGSTRHWTNDEKPLEGLLYVDGTTYRWMGAAQRTLMESVVPMANEAEWEAEYTDKKPSEGWIKPDFNASSWKKGKGAFGSDNYDNIRTSWTKEDNDIWVRRTVELTSGQLQGDLYLIFSHDDACEIYINGEKAATGIMDYVDGVIVRLDGKKANLLKEGKNVFAVHCYNKTGGALVDFGIFRNIAKGNDKIMTAEQKSVDVLACNTYYTFACGPVELDVVFTAPHIIDDYDLLSAPINYISYQVRATDGKRHSVKFYLSTTPQMAVNKIQQPTISNMEFKNGTQYLKAGTIQQPILAKTGDGICIDWGYVYLAGTNGRLALASDADIKTQFLADGRLPRGERQVVCQKQASLPTLAYVHDFGTTDKASSFAMIGYDE